MADPASVANALVDELSAIACPVDRAEQTDRVSKQVGAALAALKRQALRQARESGVAVRSIAGRLHKSRARIYQLTADEFGPPATLPSETVAGGAVNTLPAEAAR